ncbi:hypothetical protein BB8028_0006g00130 [Beauveria bassiana]|uniref:Uncharacterized protein n=1 Tax=Beauveria bassiana TaxID=176275 RepID=A0A2S7YHL6_BEABA|nr:hypothetical protein BB8028_0006g00130 [Beauveria bassiana]
MKSAAARIIFTMTLGTVLPHVYASTPTDDSSNINTTIESKLPWVDDDNVDVGECLDTLGRMSPPSAKTVNKVCGTKSFCEEFDPADLSEDDSKHLAAVYGFASAQACFDAYEQNPAASSQDTKPKAKLPWVSSTTSDYGKCGDMLLRMYEESPPSGETVNEVCGTEDFCNEFDPAIVPEDDLKKVVEVYGFKSPQKCFDAHEQKPTSS